MVHIFYNGYLIKSPNQSGGKAGKGHNKTTTLQVFKEGSHMISKQVKYIRGHQLAKIIAIGKCKMWVDSHPI